MRTLFESRPEDVRRSPGRARSGVSELIGTIIVIGMTVSLMGAVVVWVNVNITPPEKARNADLFAELELIDADRNGIYEAGKVNVTHLGGNTLERQHIRITLTISGSSTSYGLDDTDGANLGVSWNLGETWTKALSGYPNADAASDLSTREVSVMIIDTEVSKMITESLLQFGDAGGNAPIINMMWIEDRAGDRVDTLDNGGTSMFTVKAIIYDQDGNLPGDGQKIPTKVGHVVCDLTPLGLYDAMGGKTVPMWDLDGDSVYETNGTHIVPLGLMYGKRTINVTARDFAGLQTTRSINVSVRAVPLGVFGTPKVLAWISPNPVARFQDFTVYASVTDVDDNIRPESIYVNFTDVQIGGAQLFKLNDTDGDGLYTGEFEMDPPVPAGKYHLTVNASDLDDNEGMANITFNVSADFAPQIFGWGANPNPVVIGNQVRVWCYVNDVDGDVTTVEADLSSINGAWTNVTMSQVAGTNRYETAKKNIPADLGIGAYSIALHASDASITDTVYFKLYVNGINGPNITAVLVTPNPIEIDPAEMEWDDYTAYCFVQDPDDNIDTKKVYMMSESLFGAGVKKKMSASNVSGVFTFTDSAEPWGLGKLGQHPVQFWAWDTDGQVSFLIYNVTISFDSTDPGDDIDINETANVGALPTYLNWVNGRQGYDFFNGTSSKADLENATRDFRQGDWMWIRVASRDLSDVSVLNRLIFTNSTTGEPFIYYPADATSISDVSRPSSSRAFSLYTAKGPYFEYQVRIDTSEFPYGRYMVSIALQDSTPSQFGGPFKFFALDTVNITDQNWNMPFQPFILTYGDAGYNNETHIFESFDTIYVRLVVKTTNLAYDTWGDVEINDYMGGQQVKAKPPTTDGLMSAVSADTFSYQGIDNTPCYQFSIDLRYQSGDPWNPGDYAYNLNIRAFNDNDEPDSGVYKLTKNLRINSPNRVKDLVVATDGIVFGHKNFANIQYGFHFENNNFWTKTILYEEDSTPGGGGSTAYEDFSTISFQDADADGDLDAIVGATGDGSPDALIIFENRIIDAGQFEDLYVLDTGFVATAIEPGDVDGDGDKDIIVGTAGGGWFYENTRGYPKSSSFTTDSITSIAVGNLVGNDTKLDVVIATGAAAKVYQSTGTALNYVSTMATGNIDDVAVADFNGDLLDDIVISGGTSPNSVLVYYNQGSGSFGGGGSTTSWNPAGESTPPTDGTISAGSYLSLAAEDGVLEEIMEEKKFSPAGVNNDLVSGEASVVGTMASNTYSAVAPATVPAQIIQEKQVGAGPDWQLVHLYTVNGLTSTGTSWNLKIDAQITHAASGTGGGVADSFSLKWSTSSTGPWNNFAIPCSIDNTWTLGTLRTFSFPAAALNGSTAVYLKIEDSAKVDSGNWNQGGDEITIDSLYIATTSPAYHYSYLEHHWTINVPAGYDTYNFNMVARTNDSAAGDPDPEGETFRFMYSLDGGSTYKDFSGGGVSVYQTSLTDFTGKTFQAGDSPAGLTLYIRVHNTETGSSDLDSIIIDHMDISGIMAGSAVTVGDGFAVEVGDADNDGDMDIFTASDDQLHVYGNLGGSASTSWVQLDDPGNPATGTLQIDLHGNTQVDCFRVADMNGDGFADMVVTMASAGNIGNVSIYRATGMGDWEHVSAVNANAGSYSSGEIYGIDVGQSEGGSEQ